MSSNTNLNNNANGTVSEISQKNSLTVFHPSYENYVPLIEMLEANPSKFFRTIIRSYEESIELRKEIAYLQRENEELRNFVTELYVKHSQFRTKPREDKVSNEETPSSSNQKNGNVVHVTDPVTSPGFTFRIEIVALNNTEKPSEFPVNQTTRIGMPLPTAPVAEKISRLYECPTQTNLSSCSSSTISVYDSQRSSRKNSHIKLLLNENDRVPERTNSPLILSAQAKFVNGNDNREFYTSDFLSQSGSHPQEQKRSFSASEADSFEDDFDENEFKVYTRPRVNYSHSGIVGQCSSQVIPKPSKSSKQFHLKGILSRGGLSKPDQAEPKPPKSQKQSKKKRDAQNQKPKPNYSYVSSKLLDQDWSDISDCSENEH